MSVFNKETVNTNEELRNAIDRIISVDDPLASHMYYPSTSTATSTTTSATTYTPSTVYPYSETKTYTLDWKQVLNELQECPMFKGCYDALHGSERFMNGIYTVLEYIANRALSESEFEKFQDEFISNMIKCEKRAGKYSED